MQEDFEVLFEFEEIETPEVVFSIDFQPTKLSQLENDTHYINETQLNEVKTELSTKIDSEVELIQADLRYLDAKIDNEIINRQEADGVLDNKIDGVNINLTQQIEETQQDVNNKYNELVNDIDTEIQAREQADNTINQRITDVADELQQSIEDNVVALQQEDTALQNQINAHSTTLTAHDTRITNNANAISQEIIDRQNADDNLQDQIDNLKARGRFLSLWNATTGLAETNPEIDPYPYNTGDYFIVGTVGETNYKPTGTQYVIGQASTVVETEELASEDVYYFDGTIWHLQVNHGKTVSFANLAGQPSDNIALKNALDGKQDVITDLTTIRDNAQAGKTASETIATYGDIVTHNASEFQVSGDYATNTALINGLATKQDTITDLSTIREGASSGATALQSVPSEYVTDTELRAYHDNTKQDVITDLSDIRNNIATNTSNISYLDEKVRDIELFKFPNAIIIGEPTIQNGQVSGFSTVSYLQFPFILDLHEKAFQIDFSFTTATNVQTQQNILDSNFGLALAIQNGKGVMAISSNGTSWDIGSATGSINIQSNATYYARLIWNRLQYKTQLSTNGVDYVDDMVITDTRSPYPRTIFIGGCDILETGHTGHPFLGTINMNKATLSVMGQVIWQGMDDAGLTTRADLSLSNLDELGNKRFTDLQDDINTRALNSSLTAHTSNGTIHVTASDKIAWSQKQNAITDLDTIRDGASKGATALQNTDNCVHSTGNETISGIKTFSNAGYAVGGVTINNTLTGASCVKFTTRGVKTGLIGVDAISKPIFEDDETNIHNLVRSARNTTTGSTTKPVYVDANGIMQPITSYEGTATKATQDSEGNIISTTYAKKSDLEDIDEALDLLNGADITLLSTKANKTDVDGQWINAGLTLATSDTNIPATNVVYDLSDYLPNDDYNYEVMINGRVTTGSTSGNSVVVALFSSIIETVYLCMAITRTASTVTGRGSQIIPVATDRKLTLQGSSSYNGNYGLYLRGYRRLGKNI